MKKLYFFLLVLFVAGIATVSGQTHQTLTQGQIFTATLEAGEVHTYRIQLGNDAEYFIAWDDADTSYERGGIADVRVGVRGEQWGQYLIDVLDYGNFGQNVHRLMNSNHPSAKVNPLNNLRSERGRSGDVYVQNNEYIIEVRGYGRTSSGTYSIVFY